MLTSIDAVADPLYAWLADEVALTVHPAVMAMAEVIRRRHGGGCAVLFYGSCLRRGADRPPPDDGILDFYLLVDGYRNAYPRLLTAIANWLLPPNVFYLEQRWEEITLRAKYAVISLAQFRRGTSRDSIQPALWARFCQPTRLLYVRSSAHRQDVIAALREAVVTMALRVAPLFDDRFDNTALWTRGFAETYRCELRAERSDRGKSLYEADRARYGRLTPAALKASGLPLATNHADGYLLIEHGQRLARWRWIGRRVVGKLLNLMRLVKAIFTFDGGLDYVLWKVERHSHVRIAATPWQRRHPLLASPCLAWRLYRLGAFQ